MANVQIPERLFLELYSIHVLNRNPDPKDEEYVKDQLKFKFAAWQNRVNYAAKLERDRK